MKEKFKETKNLIFLCGYNDILRENEGIITEFGMKTM